jgi:L-lactate utilization protein LutB
MGEKTDEKPLFVLNLIANIINKVYPMMPRSKLDQSDEFKHIESVRQNLTLMKKYILNDLDYNLKKLKEAKKKKRLDDDE